MAYLKSFAIRVVLYFFLLLPVYLENFLNHSGIALTAGTGKFPAVYYQRNP
jgi:hypothetical protein